MRQKKSPIKLEGNRTFKIGWSNERDDYSDFSIGERILIYRKNYLTIVMFYTLI